MNLPDEGVDLDGVNVVKLLQGLLDLSLVCLDVDNEDKGVVLLDLLHGALGVQWVDDNLVLIETGLGNDGSTWVLWCTGELEGLGSAEGGRETDLADLVGVNLIESSVSNINPNNGQEELTPFKVALAAALAFLLPPLAAAPIKTYASASALEELAISATAGAHLSHSFPLYLEIFSYFVISKRSQYFPRTILRLRNAINANLRERRLYLSLLLEPFRRIYFLRD